MHIWYSMEKPYLESPLLESCVSPVKPVLHNFTKYFPGARVNQIVNKCRNG